MVLDMVNSYFFTNIGIDSFDGFRGNTFLWTDGRMATDARTTALSRLTESSRAKN